MSRLTSRITPVWILSCVAVILVAFVMLVPQVETGTPYSSYSSGPSGARGLYDVLRRLGYPVQRDTNALSVSLDSDATYFILDPSSQQSLTTLERSNVLGAARRGATLVVTLTDEALTDSLGFEIRPALDRFHTLGRTSVQGGNPPDSTLDFRTLAFPLSSTVRSKPVTTTSSPTSDEAFMWLDGRASAADKNAGDSTQALVLGHPFGRGYVIGIASPQLVTNQLLRDSRPAIAVVRALEAAGRNTDPRRAAQPVVFDEYHHGFGSHADMVSTVQTALTDTPPGRMALQAVAAALILILAVGSRPIAPIAAQTVSRRSPLEHVGALAQAYLQVDAQRLGARRLVDGLRRRHPLGVARSVPQSVYLAVLRDRFPGVSTEIDRVATALESESQSFGHFATIGAAVANIERMLKRD